MRWWWKVSCIPSHGVLTLLPPVQSPEPGEAKGEWVGHRYVWRIQLSFASVRVFFLFVLCLHFPPSRLQRLNKFLRVS